MASMFAKGKQHRGRVLRQQGEPDVIRGRDRAAQGVLVDVADLEVLKEPAPPALPLRRTAPSLRVRGSNIASESPGI